MRILLFLLCIALMSCGNASSEKKIDQTYKDDIEAFWKSKNEVRKDNYLQLSGLLKLADSSTVFGLNASNQPSTKKEDLQTIFGNYTQQGDSLVFTPAENKIITVEADTISARLPMVFDSYGSSQMLHQQHMKWQIITRGDNRYIRVWDAKNTAIDAFKGFETFPLNPNFILEGQFTYYDQTQTKDVASKLGYMHATDFAGFVSFEFKGKEYKLDTEADGFIMLGDATSGNTTYGGGRYYVLEIPSTNGPVTIDFNRLYNPPCAYCAFTTCLLPPSQNQLPFEILAGETTTRL
ncbi:DUF1684 domain-containing protein [Mangrovimonas sp. YM274]|uniref:DUF1684 domain-containing protein n=1 Tax=Mangrovimonas sp. YM274 TaxID=3070660 RepID=UPI0027DE18A8|nr:DUF1684 domain-containing protein [Mangrovimonas sp. YM274]WMI69879.1 DUF1684 domain-containing protein [Mangrovimonas sp. YM274]